MDKVHHSLEQVVKERDELRAISSKLLGCCITAQGGPYTALEALARDTPMIHAILPGLDGCKKQIERVIKEAEEVGVPIYL